MKKFFGIILILLIATDSFSQYHDSVKELYAINLLGAKVYEKPTFDSEILSVLKSGEKIKIEKSIDTKDSFMIGEGFSLEGVWIKPLGNEGFVFSSDFTNKKPEFKTNEYGQTFINLLGKLEDEKSGEELINTERGEFPKYHEFKNHENGTYSLTIWDGCFDHVTEYKKLTIGEVYHQMVSDYTENFQTSDGNTLCVPVFKERSGKTIKFKSDTAAHDLQIEILDNGMFGVSSYDCT